MYDSFFIQYLRVGFSTENRDKPRFFAMFSINKTYDVPIFFPLYGSRARYLFRSFVESLLQETEITDGLFISRLLDQHIITKLTTPQSFVRFNTNLYLRSVIFTETPHFELGVSIIEHMSRLCKWLFGQTAVSMIRNNLRYRIVTLLRDYIISGVIRDYGGNNGFYNIEIRSLDNLSTIISLINDNIPEDFLERISIEDIKTVIDDYLDDGHELEEKNLYSIFDEQLTSETIIENYEKDTPILLESNPPIEFEENYHHSKHVNLPIIQDITHYGTVTCYRCGKMDVEHSTPILIDENEYYSLITCSQCATKFYLKSSNRR